MKIYKKIIILLSLFTLFACGTMNEAGKVLRNEKIRTNDEFLVEKKDPLIIPPNINQLPVPESMVEINEKNKVKKILNKSKQVNNKTSNTSSIEESIINQINK